LGVVDKDLKYDMTKIIQKWNGIRARLSLELLTALRLSCFIEATELEEGLVIVVIIIMLIKNTKHKSIPWIEKLLLETSTYDHRTDRHHHQTTGSTNMIQTINQQNLVRLNLYVNSPNPHSGLASTKKV
jgi:hypothetical protein